jgi:hypothetical protein
MESFTINNAINNSKKSKRNIFTFGEVLRLSHFSLLHETINSNINSKIRFCFCGSPFLDESIECLEKLAECFTDIDALLFINMNINNYNRLFRLISSIKNLAILSFSNSNLKDASLDDICNSIKELKYLKTFSVISERCDSSYFNGVCRALEGKEYLVNFQWKDTNIGDCWVFSGMFRSCPLLSNIDISDITLDEDWRNVLKNLLDEDWKLEELVVSDFNASLRSKIAQNRNHAKEKNQMPSYGLFNIIHNA